MGDDHDHFLTFFSFMRANANANASEPVCPSPPLAPGLPSCFALPYPFIKYANCCWLEVVWCGCGVV